MIQGCTFCQKKKKKKKKKKRGKKEKKGLKLAGNDSTSFSPPGHSSKYCLSSLLLDIHDQKEGTKGTHQQHSLVYRSLTIPL